MEHCRVFWPNLLSAVYVDGYLDIFVGISKCVITKETSSNKQQSTQLICLLGLTVKGYRVNLQLVRTSWRASPRISHTPEDLSSLYTDTHWNKIRWTLQIYSKGGLRGELCLEGYSSPFVCMHLKFNFVTTNNHNDNNALLQRWQFHYSVNFRISFLCSEKWKSDLWEKLRLNR